MCCPAGVWSGFSYSVLENQATHQLSDSETGTSVEKRKTKKLMRRTYSEGKLFQGNMKNTHRLSIKGQLQLLSILSKNIHVHSVCVCMCV